MYTIRAIEQCGAHHYFKCESRASAEMLIAWLKFSLGTDTVSFL